MGTEVILKSTTEKQVYLMPACCLLPVTAGIRGALPLHSQLHFGLCLTSAAKVDLCTAIS